jgi:uncharacterized protein (DUF934 family)
VVDDEALPSQAPVIVSLDRLTLAGAELGGVEPHSLGIHLGPDADPATLTDLFPRIGMIVVGFPGTADGRGFSIARRLRALGYSGRLRATGPVVADQYAFLRSCGFDEVAPVQSVAVRQPVEQWLEAAKSMSVGYQRGYAGTQNILEARRQASSV